MLPACFRGLISIPNEQAARSTRLTEKLVSAISFQVGFYRYLLKSGHGSRLE